MSSNFTVLKICEYCGKQFQAKKTTTHCCSGLCSKKMYKARLRESKIQKVHTETKEKQAKPLNELQSKDYLSVSDVCQLIGVSRRTIYRMISRKELSIGKFGKRTILKRSEIDNIFNKQIQEIEKEPGTKPMTVTEWIGLSEIQEKYKVSPKALNDIIKRNDIPRLQEGIFVFISKQHIENIFKTKQP